MHISWVLKRSGIRKNTAGLTRITSQHISGVLRWSGISLSVYISLRTASLQISCALKRSGTYNHLNHFRDIDFIYLWAGWRSNFMDRTQITSNWSIYRCKKPMKTYLNSRWKMTIQLSKLYLELGHLSIYKQWTYTKKLWFFLKKRWNHTLRWSFYHYKTYENILKFTPLGTYGLFMQGLWSGNLSM